MNIEYKCVGVNGLKVLDEEEGIIETFVSVTGLRDNVKDTIQPGAYEKTLKTRIPKGVWHHQWTETISRTEEVKELLPGDPELPESMPNGQPWPTGAGALKIKTRFNLDTQRGREAYSDVKFFGDQQEWSIGYHVPVGGATIDSKTGERKIFTLDLYEYSPVLFGAMPAARTAGGVKEAQLAYKALNSEDIEAFMVETKDFITELEQKNLVPPADEEYVDEEEDEEVDEDEEEEYDDEKSLFYSDDAVDLKALSISPAQADTLRTLISDLEGILNAGEPTDGAVQQKNLLAEMVTKAFPNDDMLENDALQYDIAILEGDQKSMEEFADSIVSAVEDAIKEGEEKSKFADILTSIIEGFESIATKDDDEDADEVDAEPVVEDTESSGEKVLFDMTQVKALFGEV